MSGSSIVCSPPIRSSPSFSRDRWPRSAPYKGQLRGTHLEAHLAQVNILNDEQVMLYARLRGYGVQSPSSENEHHY
jgi:hypothetical protein